MCPDPDPWADPRNRSTLGLYNVQHRSITESPELGLLLLDPPRGLKQEPPSRGGAQRLHVAVWHIHGP